MANEKQVENKNLFDSVEATQAVPTIPVEEEDESVETSDELISEDFVPIIAEQSQQQREEEFGVKKEMNNAQLTIASVDILPPKTKKTEAGVIHKIAPSLTTKSRAPHYKSKLRVRFKEDNLVEYLPSINFWVNDGKVNPLVKLDRYGNSKVSILVRMALQKMSNNAFVLEQATINERATLVVSDKTKDAFLKYEKTISDSDILKWLVGKKVKISTSKGVYEGKEWFRNDIVEIIA